MTTDEKVCTVDGCGKDNRKGTGGLCAMHTQRLKRTGTLGSPGYQRDPRRTIEERVYSRLAENPDTGCWEWQAAASRVGYGVFGIGRKVVLVHRWVYEHMVAGIPEGLVIDHLCCNRRCANPYHLDVVTRAVNNARGGFTTQGARSKEKAA